MLSKQVQLTVSEITRGWSSSVMNFINGLLKRKPQDRLGVNGPMEIKSHPWLNDINWKNLSEKKLTPPFVPNVTVIIL